MNAPLTTAERRALAETAATESQPADEIFVSLAQRLGLPAINDEPARVIGLTSSMSGEGVTSVLWGLSAAIAERSQRGILLIDANRARPGLSTSCGGELTPGWTDVCSGRTDLSAAVRTAPIPNTWRLPPGSVINSLPPVAEFLAECRERFGAVLIDLPPPGSGRDVGPLAAALDGIVLVVEAERVGRDTVRRTAKTVERAGARVLGVVFNKQRSYVPEWLTARL